MAETKRRIIWSTSPVWIHPQALLRALCLWCRTGLFIFRKEDEMDVTDVIWKGIRVSQEAAKVMKIRRVPHSRVHPPDSLESEYGPREQNLPLVYEDCEVKGMEDGQEEE